jgi:tellurite resistance protein TehA-like permease
MNLIVPLAIVPLIAANPGQAPWLVPVALAFWGIGAILFVALLAVLVARLAFRDPIAAPMAPSLWIPLAPAGVVGLSLLRTLQAGVETGVFPESIVALGVVVAAAGIGFGLWWALFAWFDLVRARHGGLAFHPGWWGFVFPLAAMSLSTSAVGTTLDALFIQAAGAAMAVVVALVWVVVAFRTLRSLLPARTPIDPEERR